MSLIINNKEINNVCVIDDDEQARDVWSLAIEDSKLRPFLQNERVTNINDYLPFLKKFDAIVTDHHLMKRNYFPVNGAEIVYKCYDKQIPAILVTRWEQAVIDEIRIYRQKVPVILSPDEFDPDSLIKSLSICIDEIKGKPTQERKLWRTFIKIDDKYENHVYLWIPAWNPNQIVSTNKNIFPPDVFELLEQEMKLFAKVNIGAENSNDLYFTDWELK